MENLTDEYLGEFLENFPGVFLQQLPDQLLEDLQRNTYKSFLWEFLNQETPRGMHKELFRGISITTG